MTEGDTNNMTKIIVTHPLGVDLPAISPDRVGESVFSQIRITRTRDWLSDTLIWECTPGSFFYEYTHDETAVIIEGKATITDCDSQEKFSLAIGEIAVFPKGSKTYWEVTDRLRKVAVVKESSVPLGLFIKVGRAVSRRMFGHQ